LCKFAYLHCGEDCCPDPERPLAAFVHVRMVLFRLCSSRCWSRSGKVVASPSIAPPAGPSVFPSGQPMPPLAGVALRQCHFAPAFPLFVYPDATCRSRSWTLRPFHRHVDLSGRLACSSWRIKGELLGFLMDEESEVALSWRAFTFGRHHGLLPFLHGAESSISAARRRES
jgi:hypothetical protein